MKNLPTIVAVLLGLLFIIFGLNNFLHFYAPGAPSDPSAGAFAGALFSSYLGPFMGVIEIASGVLMLFPRTRFLGSLLLLPITANIVLFHLTFDFPGASLIWVFTTLLHAILLYFQRSQLASLIGPPATT